MVALLLIAASLGLSNFAASIAIGISGVDRRVRTRVALAFGLFEAGMPIIGLLLGHALAQSLGSSAHIIGGALLIAAGAQTTYQAVRADSGGDSEHAVAAASVGRLLTLAAALSIDNLVVGFALGTYHANVLLSVALIAAISIGLSLIGLELGSRLGARVEHDSELIGGVVLIAVGLAVLTNLL